MAPQKIFSNWTIEKGDYERNADYDIMFLERRTFGGKMKKFILATAGFAISILGGIFYFNVK